MDNQYTKLVDALNRFDQAVKNFSKTLQSVKEHDEKYKYLYANGNSLPRKQIM